MKKPCRLEIKAGGAWRLIAKFDATDNEAASDVMDAAERLVQALNAPEAGGNGRSCLRISADDQPPTPLQYWEPERGMWTDARSGEPA
jgi:hypothetical protein